MYQKTFTSIALALLMILLFFAFYLPFSKIIDGIERTTKTQEKMPLTEEVEITENTPIPKLHDELMEMEIEWYRYDFITRWLDKNPLLYESVNNAMQDGMISDKEYIEIGNLNDLHLEEERSKEKQLFKQKLLDKLEELNAKRD